MSAIVKTGAASIDIAGELPQIFRLATALKQAGGFLPAHIRSEGELVAIILAGAEIGLPPMVSLRSIHLVQGRVTIAADQQLGLMRRAGAKTRWLADGSDGRATIEVTPPNGAPVVTTYTMDDARAAGLLGKDMWKKFPSQMLRARCVSAAAKMAMPEVLAGVYLAEELEDDAKPAPVVSVVTEQAAAPQLAAGAAPAKAKSAVVEAELEPARDEYGLSIPAGQCPVVRPGKPNAGKSWADLPGGLLEKMYADFGDKMTPHDREWATYLLAKRQARKAREAAQTAMLDANADGGGYLADDGDAEPANVLANDEAAQ